MSRKTFYRQCRLVRKTPTGTMTQVSWMPEPYCVKDKVLKLKLDDGSWENGWVVQGAGENRLPQDQVPDSHTMIKGHRKNTGDSEPKVKNKNG